MQLSSLLPSTQHRHSHSVSSGGVLLDPVKFYKKGSESLPETTKSNIAGDFSDKSDLNK